MYSVYIFIGVIFSMLRETQPGHLLIMTHRQPDGPMDGWRTPSPEAQTSQDKHFRAGTRVNNMSMYVQYVMCISCV